MKYKVECWSCGGEGYIEGECTCMDDTCCCLEPDQPICSECRGRGYLIVSELTEDNCETAVTLPEPPET